jgi:hypothetical protein
MHVERNAAAAKPLLIGHGRMARSRKPDSGPTGTLSLTTRRRRASWNLMKPRIQRVLTQWNPGSSAFGGAFQRSETPDPVRSAGRSNAVKPDPVRSAGVRIPEAAGGAGEGVTGG